MANFAYFYLNAAVNSIPLSRGAAILRRLRLKLAGVGSTALTRRLRATDVAHDAHGQCVWLRGANAHRHRDPGHGAVFVPGAFDCSGRTDVRHGGERAGAGARRPHRLQCVEHECHALRGLSPCERPPCQNNINGALQDAPFFAGRRGRWPGSRVKKGSTGGSGRTLNETSAKRWKRRPVASSDAEYHCQCEYSRRRGRRRHGFFAEVSEWFTLNQ